MKRQDTNSAGTEENKTLRARVARLEDALPDPNKLEILARWVDMQYPADTNPEVQNDLREWAKKDSSRTGGEMNGIAKCPVCGKAPVKMVFGAGWAQDGYKCCGHTANTLKQWNQYAAAMELARFTVQMKTYRAYCPEMAFLHAQDRVLEVFK